MYYIYFASKFIIPQTATGSSLLTRPCPRPPAYRAEPAAQAPFARYGLSKVSQVHQGDPTSQPHRCVSLLQHHQGGRVLGQAPWKKGKNSSN